MHRIGRSFTARTAPDACDALVEILFADDAVVEKNAAIEPKKESFSSEESGYIRPIADFGLKRFALSCATMDSRTIEFCRFGSNAGAANPL